MSDYLDPSRYEPVIGPIEEEFCGMLDAYDPADMCAHDKLVAFVADLELKLATSNNQLEYIEGIVTADGKTMQQRLTAIEESFRRDALTKPAQCKCGHPGNPWHCAQGEHMKACTCECHRRPAETEPPLVPKGHFWRGEINRHYCKNCGKHYDAHLHTDEASTCPAVSEGGSKS